MATREEIREGIFKVLFPYSNADHYTGDGTVQKVLDYLHSEGVVIKVDRELPEDLDVWKETRRGGYFIGSEALEEAGYVAVEPLIEEVKK